MNYCRKCHILFEDNLCPRCGNRYVYAPEGEDYCYLTEKSFLDAELLEGALHSDGIPVVTAETVVGAWLTKSIGSLKERHKLFVPYTHLERARAIEQEMFAGEDDPLELSDNP